MSDEEVKEERFALFNGVIQHENFLGAINKN